MSQGTLISLMLDLPPFSGIKSSSPLYRWINFHNLYDTTGGLTFITCMIISIPRSECFTTQIAAVIVIAVPLRMLNSRARKDFRLLPLDHYRGENPTCNATKGNLIDLAMNFQHQIYNDMAISY
ncbi:hypothetical protein WUBG_05525 [Wuchereria bancrofti]|uniref:Uncharacterized protein n=1 Tax=Wuchereria bancrofti TaxID=6293 RepID=J9F2A0_WUCBA|nr:hypothetical protein WUBG_05525 [Wuchereria bancrofti]